MGSAMLARVLHLFFNPEEWGDHVEQHPMYVAFLNGFMCNAEMAALKASETGDAQQQEKAVADVNTCIQASVPFCLVHLSGQTFGDSFVGGQVYDLTLKSQHKFGYPAEGMGHIISGPDPSTGIMREIPASQASGVFGVGNW